MCVLTFRQIESICMLKDKSDVIVTPKCLCALTKRTSVPQNIGFCTGTGCSREKKMACVLAAENRMFQVFDQFSILSSELFMDDISVVVSGEQVYNIVSSA